MSLMPIFRRVMPLAHPEPKNASTRLLMAYNGRPPSEASSFRSRRCPGVYRIELKVRRHPDVNSGFVPVADLVLDFECAPSYNVVPAAPGVCMDTIPQHTMPALHAPLKDQLKTLEHFHPLQRDETKRGTRPRQRRLCTLPQW